MYYYKLYKFKNLILNKNINYFYKIINVKNNWIYISSTYLPRSFKNFRKEKKLRQKIYILRNILKEKIKFC